MPLAPPVMTATLPGTSAGWGRDCAYNAMMYRMPPHIVAGLLGADIASLGILSEEDYVAAYCTRTGREAMPGYDFYCAFNFFRLAAIFHGIKGRVIRGIIRIAKPICSSLIPSNIRARSAALCSVPRARSVSKSPSAPWTAEQRP